MNWKNLIDTKNLLSMSSDVVEPYKKNVIINNFVI